MRTSRAGPGCHSNAGRGARAATRTASSARAALAIVSSRALDRLATPPCYATAEVRGSVSRLEDQVAASRVHVDPRVALAPAVSHDLAVPDDGLGVLVPADDVAAAHVGDRLEVGVRTEPQVHAAAARVRLHASQARPLGLDLHVAGAGVHLHLVGHALLQAHLSRAGIDVHLARDDVAQPHVTGAGVTGEAVPLEAGDGAVPAPGIAAEAPLDGRDAHVPGAGVGHDLALDALEGHGARAGVEPELARDVAA